MKIFKEEDKIFLEGMVKSYQDARGILKIKQEEILALSKDIEIATKALETIRVNEGKFMKMVAEREGIEESKVIELVLIELESKK
mgnify:CR=1 FL=1